MHFRAILGATIIATIVVLSAHANTGVPGWFMAGSDPSDYELGVVAQAGRHGGPAAFLKSKDDPRGFGTMMQSFSATDYAGSRVRLSGLVRSDGVADWAGVWMRVDGEKNETLAFDNMQDRAIKGTTAWQRYDVVLDVAPDAKQIALGVLLSGEGEVWLEPLTFEVVPDTVPVTGKSEDAEDVQRAPQNLDFAQH